MSQRSRRLYLFEELYRLTLKALHQTQPPSPANPMLAAERLHKLNDKTTVSVTLGRTCELCDSIERSAIISQEYVTDELQIARHRFKRWKAETGHTILL